MSHTLLLFWQALQLDFYGDGVVEAWRGTQHGEPSVRCQDGPAILEAHFGPEYESHVWGIAGTSPLFPSFSLRGKGILDTNAMTTSSRACDVYHEPYSPS